MRKTIIKTVGTVIIFGFLFVCAYLLGTTQVTTVIEVKEVEKVVEVVPDGYIALEHCIPLEDIACYYLNDAGYLCVELKDIQHQLDDTHNNAYMNVLEGLEDVTEGFYNRYLDMTTVIGYSGAEQGLQLYTDNGCGYYLEVGLMNWRKL